MSTQAIETATTPPPKRGRPPMAKTAETQSEPRVVEHVKAQEPKAKATPKKAVETPPQEKPGPSNVGADTPKLVRSIGGIIIGLGIIGAVVWWFGSDFVMMALYIALPVLIIAVALQLISWSTVQLIWNGELKERVSAYVADMDKK